MEGNRGWGERVWPLAHRARHLRLRLGRVAFSFVSEPRSVGERTTASGARTGAVPLQRRGKGLGGARDGTTTNAFRSRRTRTCMGGPPGATPWTPYRSHSHRTNARLDDRGDVRRCGTRLVWDVGDRRGGQRARSRPIAPMVRCGRCRDRRPRGWIAGTPWPKR